MGDDKIIDKTIIVFLWFVSGLFFLFSVAILQMSIELLAKNLTIPKILLFPLGIVGFVLSWFLIKPVK